MCCSRNEKKSDEVELCDEYLFVITPRDNEEDDDDPSAGGGGNDQVNSRGLRKIIDEKFKEIDAFLNKRVLKNLMDLSTDTGTRLDQLERGNFFM